jgi:hypothetical protein
VGRVVKVLVRHGDTVDAVSVLYDRGGREEWTWTDLWGGPGGGFSPGLCGHCNSRQVCLRLDEYLTSVGGHCPLPTAARCRAASSCGRSRSSATAAYGRSGVPFALPAAGGRILAFHARSGRHLDAIGTYVLVEPRH